MIDGKTFIKYERELEEAEVSVIHLLSATKLSIPQFEVNLASIFPTKIFCKSLLGRMRNRYLDMIGIIFQALQRLNLILLERVVCLRWYLIPSL
jgi:hypothetical protein